MEYSKNWYTWNKYWKDPKIEQFGFSLQYDVYVNEADRMANSEDPDQTAPQGAVWLVSSLFWQSYLS